MAYLLSFTKDESALFEALWIGFRTGDAPKFGKEVKSSIRIEDQLIENSVEGGKINLSLCPCCGQRVAIHNKLRTLPEGGFCDLLLEDDDFEYLRTCLAKWVAIPPELKRHFFVIDARLTDAKPRSSSEWNRFIKERDGILRKVHPVVE